LDPLLDTWETTLDRPDRIRQLAQIERIVMDDLPAIPLYYNTRSIAYVAGLRGVGSKLVETGGVERRIWEWEWQS
jgi:ABC-type transport system substrate-binding protein